MPTVEITQTGAGGGITYREGNNSVHFSWEFALPPALALIYCPTSRSWEQKYPWAAGRQAEIFDFVGEEVIRQKADGCKFLVDLDTGHIMITQWRSRRQRAAPTSKIQEDRKPSERTPTYEAAPTSEIQEERKPPEHSPAYQEFLASVVPYANQWKEDQTYNVAAIAEMTATERDQVVELLTGRDATWREVVALAAINTPQAHAALEAATKHHLSIDTRLAAADLLHQQGRFADLEIFLARQIRLLNRPADGLKRALLVAERHPSETVKQALLWASYNSTECAPHCAKLLLVLTGAAKEPFTADVEQMLAKLGLHNSYFDRKAAFDELCQRVQMELGTQAGD